MFSIFIGRRQASAYPYSVIIALCDNTSILIWPGSHKIWFDGAADQRTKFTEPPPKRSHRAEKSTFTATSNAATITTTTATNNATTTTTTITLTTDALMTLRSRTKPAVDQHILLAAPTEAAQQPRLQRTAVLRSKSSREATSPIKVQRVPVRKGHAILFLQDEVHAGDSSYPAESQGSSDGCNTRIHFYGDVVGLARKTDFTAFVSQAEPDSHNGGLDLRIDSAIRAKDGDWQARNVKPTSDLPQ